MAGAGSAAWAALQRASGGRAAPLLTAQRCWAQRIYECCASVPAVPLPLRLLQDAQDDKRSLRARLQQLEEERAQGSG